MPTFSLTAAVQAAITGTHSVQADLQRYVSSIQIGPTNENLTSSTKVVSDRRSGNAVIDLTAGVYQEGTNTTMVYTQVNLIYFKIVSGTGSMIVGGGASDIMSQGLRITGADKWFLIRNNWTVDGLSYQLTITTSETYDFCIIGL